ncbi:MAG: MlaD family protein [Candidatus Gastranaerophilales bacterium]|nr:MlaD family protein [Candidatus Gastranaerophilales bacterium]
MKITAALKVGILTLVAILILIVGIGWLKGRSISNGQVLDLKFYDVDGLRVGAPVQMMGYRIGQVESLTPVFDSKQNYVSIKAVITQAGIKIPKASLISIQQSGIIGEKFVEITPPQVKMAYIPKIDNSSPKINTHKRVRVFLDGDYEDIGKVVSVKVIDVRALAKLHQKEFSTPYAYEIAYMITKTGILIPDEVSAKISESNDLVLLPLNNEIVRYY